MDPLDVSLEDADLLGEVELTAALIVAANQADEPMTRSQIDEILGLVPERDGADPTAPAPAAAVDPPTAAASGE